jgi:hypothetical protein
LFSCAFLILKTRLQCFFVTFDNYVAAKAGACGQNFLNYGVGFELLIFYCFGS